MNDVPKLTAQEEARRAEMSDILRAHGYGGHHAERLVREGMGPFELEYLLDTMIPGGFSSIEITHGIFKPSKEDRAVELKARNGFIVKLRGVRHGGVSHDGEYGGGHSLWEAREQALHFLEHTGTGNIDIVYATDDGLSLVHVETVRDYPTNKELDARRKCETCRGRQCRAEKGYLVECETCNGFGFMR